MGWKDWQKDCGNPRGLAGEVRAVEELSVGAGRVVGCLWAVVCNACALRLGSLLLRTADNRQQTTLPSPHMIVKRFEDLDVYQLALALQREIFQITKNFPKEERYSLTDQIRRSSRSVAANIAEGWHKRRYPAHLALKLTDADAECAETRHWLQTSLDCEYLTNENFDHLTDRCLAVGAKLDHMIQNAETWQPRQ